MSKNVGNQILIFAIMRPISTTELCDHCRKQSLFHIDQWNPTKELVNDISSDVLTSKGKLIKYSELDMFYKALDYQQYQESKPSHSSLLCSEHTFIFINRFMDNPNMVTQTIISLTQNTSYQAIVFDANLSEDKTYPSITFGITDKLEEFLTQFNLAYMLAKRESK